jgi:TIR domain
MPMVFVSYARVDQKIVQSLVRELHELGYDAFYDQELTGGQRWWDVLLDKIYETDGFLPVLTAEYRQSEACHREAVWAESLNKPFVPIDVGQASPDLFERVVADANWVRYSLDDRGSVARLSRALAALPRTDPPSPLPARPAIPISYFAELEREIRTAPSIGLERQLTIVATLRSKLFTREDASARIMLREMRNRTDVAYGNALDIDRILSADRPDPAGAGGNRPMDSPDVSPSEPAGTMPPSESASPSATPSRGKLIAAAAITVVVLAIAAVAVVVALNSGNGSPAAVTDGGPAGGAPRHTTSATFRLPTLSASVPRSKPPGHGRTSQPAKPSLHDRTPHLAPFRSVGLFRLAQPLFGDARCAATPRAQLGPTAQRSRRVELITCSDGRYSALFWRTASRSDLLYDRSIYLADALPGSGYHLSGRPFGVTRPGAVQEAYLHKHLPQLPAPPRVYWEATGCLCAAQLQAPGTVSLTKMIEFWRNGPGS